jgi:pimeloyl-ACP methyl ester carboxylesterase
MKSIIVLHGWGLSADAFTPLKNVLENKGFRVFIPDLPGFGKAESPTAPVDLSFYVDYLHAYIQCNRISQPIVIGHSFGGRIALKFQYICPGVIHALVLTGVPGFTPTPRKRLVIFIALAKIGKIVFSIPPFNLFQSKLRSWYYYLVGARDYYRANTIMRETFKKIVQERLDIYMKKISVPCMLVWGASDLITPLWIAKRMKETINGATLQIIPDTDHGVSYKQPELFYSTITSFLQTV